jgi:putative FmdB family regulatory protein
MPFYDYMCDDCGVQFEKLFKSISAAPAGVACPECGAGARKLVTAANHTFKHAPSQTRGALPPNTGTSDDWNFDRAIGRDAEQKWGVIGQRDGAKVQVIKDEAKAGRRVTRDHLVPTGEAPGDYRVVSEPERKWINTSRKAAEQARTTLTTPPEVKAQP